MMINKSLKGGKTQGDPIEAAKRKIFLIGTPIGILSMFGVWWMGLEQATLTVSNTYILPLLAVFFLLLLLLLWRDFIPLRGYELIVFGLVLAYALGEFISVIFNATFINRSFSPNFTLWLPLVYILSFLVLSTNRALLLSVLIFITTLLLGLASCFYFMAHASGFPNVTLLVQIYFASGFYIAILYLIAQIKERYLAEHAMADKMSRLAMTDSLTQVDNRRLLTQYLREEVSRAERHNLPLSVILFDLDHFKKINDFYGHNTGDEVLQAAAQVLRQSLRTSDVFGRWGGDEFLCLALNTDIKKAAELAERLREILQEHRFGAVPKVTASFGVTAYLNGDIPETLIRRADLGLYKAKAGGRNRVEAVIAGITLPIFEGERPAPEPDDEGD